MISRRITIIDSGSLLHAVKFSLGKTRLSNKDKPTFVIYGFLMRLRTLLEHTHHDICVFAFDSKTSVRQAQFSSYKSKRKSNKTDEQIELDKLAYPQFREIEKYVIPTIGWRNVFKAEGFEADDIIAKICKRYKQDYITIITNDKDLYQLLTPKVIILDPRRNEIVTDKDFIKKYGIEPKMWKRVKTYGGCTSDEVPGIPIPNDPKGKCIGEGYALKFVKGELPAHYKAYKAFVTPSNNKTISRNKSLVILPHRKCPEFRIVPDNKLTQQGLAKVVRKYAFESMTLAWNSYCKALKLKVKRN